MQECKLTGSEMQHILSSAKKFVFWRYNTAKNSTGWRVEDAIISNAYFTATWPMDSKVIRNFCCAAYSDTFFPT